MKVSVVVPVYNTEKYLKRCLDSLVNQTLKDIEIIIINDNSPDNSKLILDEYEKKYKSKIKVFHNKTNKGIGYNRNLGIKKATGEYISFVDSDDWVDNDYLESMYLLATKNKLDFVVCEVKKIDDNDNILGYENIPAFDISNLLDNKQLLLDVNLGPANKLIKKDLFDKETIFSEKLKYEDLYVLPKLLLKAKKIGKDNNTFYNYLIHSGSETTTVNERCFDIFEVLDKVNYDLKSIHKSYELEYLNIRTIFRYTLQQKYQENKKVAREFIEKSFEYLNNNYSNWRKNKFWKKRNYFKRIIEGNKILTKIYCNIWYK